MMPRNARLAVVAEWWSEYQVVKGGVNIAGAEFVVFL